MVFLRSDIDGACSMPIKLLTYTSISHRVRCRFDGFRGRVLLNVANVCFYRGL